MSDGNEYKSSPSDLILSFRDAISGEFSPAEKELFVESYTTYLDRNPSDFAIDFDDAAEWLGYNKRGNLLALLKQKFNEGQDFKVNFNSSEHSSESKSRAGRPMVKYLITIDAFKRLCMLAGTPKADDVRRYYVKLEYLFLQFLRKLNEQQKTVPLTPDEFGLLEGHRNARRRLLIGDADPFAPTRGRWSVQMVVDELVKEGRIKSSDPRIENALSQIGREAAKLFLDREGSGEVKKVPDGPGWNVTWKDKELVVVQDMTSEIANNCRMKHSVAYELPEVHSHKVHDVWTYPASFKPDMERITCDIFKIPMKGVMGIESGNKSNNPWTLARRGKA